MLADLLLGICLAPVVRLASSGWARRGSPLRRKMFLSQSSKSFESGVAASRLAAVGSREQTASRALRIAHLMLGSFGGAERFMFRLAGSLARNGQQQMLIVNDDADFLAAVRASALPYRVMPPSAWGAWLDRRRIARVLRDFEADVVMAWMNRAARRLPLGVCASVGRLGGYYALADYRRCGSLIANAPGIFEHCLANGRKVDELELIHNFSDDFGLLARAKRVAGGPFRIMALGRFDAWKGFDTLLRAVALVDGVVLEIAGKGPQEAPLKALCENLRIASRVKFLGWIDDRATLFARSDLLVVPSLHEPLGNVILEAWSARCPVLAADSEGPSWLIEEGRTGWLFPRGEHLRLAEKLVEVIADDNLANAVANMAYEKWQAEFSEDRVREAYLDHFTRASESWRSGGVNR